MYFSPTKKSLVDFVALYFHKTNYQIDHFNSEYVVLSLRNLNARTQDYENSPAHFPAFLDWKQLERTLNKGELIEDLN